MPRSIRVRKESIGSVKLAVRRNGFLSQRALAEEVGLALATVSNFLTGKPVDRAVFEDLCQRLALDREEIAVVEAETAPQPLVVQPIPSPTHHQDWREAPDTTIFYGRAKELLMLEQWVLHDRCRLISILGMGGIGKTALSVKLAQQLQQEFEYVVWRSLRNAPPVEELLKEIIQCLAHQEVHEPPSTFNSLVAQLLEYCRQHRCLLVLDNCESILQEETHSGEYQAEYEGYGYLLKCLGETHHQSCVILTSREKPSGLFQLEGVELPVRSLRLAGLDSLEGSKIFGMKGYSNLNRDLQPLVERYGGNPLALKVVSTTIQELFDSNVDEFLKQDTALFGDIWKLLYEQFSRLSPLEVHIMYWLAIEREWTSIPQLCQNLFPSVMPRHLLDALDSLQRRCLIEKQSACFTQQPVVMEFVIDLLIERIGQELETEAINSLNHVALIKSQSKDYLRNAQLRIVLQPISNKLLANFKAHHVIKEKIAKILHLLHTDVSKQVGYAAGNLINILGQLNIDLTGFDFSGLSVWQAYLKDANLHHVNFSNADLTSTVFTETFGSILWVTFSPDGKQIASGDTDGEIRLWQVADGKQLFRDKAHSNWIRCVAFNPDGTILASGSADQTVKLWNLETHECLHTCLGHTSRVWCVTFSPNGEILASSSDDQTIRLWQVSTGKCLQVLQGHSDRIRSLAFSVDGQTLVSGSDDCTVIIWHVKTSKALRTLEGHTKGIRSVAISSTQAFLASGSADHTVKLWDLKTGNCYLTLEGHRDEVWTIAFSPDNELIVSGSNDRAIKVWNVSTGECLRILHGHLKGVWSVSFSPSEQLLASGSYDQTIRFWDLQTGQCIRTLQGYTNGIRSVCCSPDGKTVAVSSADQAVRIWHVSTGMCQKTLQGHEGQVWSVAFSPNGQLLASGSEDHTVKLWDLGTGKCLKIFEGHTNWVWSVAFSPDGQTLASSGDDTTVKVWDIKTAKCLATFEGHTNWVWSVAFSPDGQTLASSSSDRTIRLWNIQTGECFNILQGHTNGIRKIVFSPDGCLIASGSEDQTIRIWSVDGGQCIRVLEGHTDWIWSASFGLDGKTLISGSNDQTIRLWNVQTGECLKVLRGHTNWVRAATFSPNGETIVSGSEDETTRIWNPETGECVKSLISPRPYEGMNISGTSGLSDAQKITLKALGASESVTIF